MALTKIVTNAITDDAITAAKIADGTIVAADLAANSVDSSELVDGGIDLSHMSVNSIDSDQYVDGSIDTAHLAASAVTNAKTNFQPGTTFKGDGSSTDGKITINCSANSHGVSIQSPAHASAASYTLTLPTTDGSADEFMQTNGSGVLTWASASAGFSDMKFKTASETYTVPTGITKIVIDLISAGLYEISNCNP